MKAYISPLHDHHWSGNALVRGRLQLHHDAQGRGREVLAALQDLQMPCEFVQPLPQAVPELAQIHDAGYLDFLRTAWQRWSQLPDASFELRPNIWPNHHFPVMRGTSIVAQAGRYLGDEATPIVQDTWANISSAVETAATAAQALIDCNGSEAVYALMRPSGHHAMSDMGQGGCLLANTAIATQRLTHRWPKIAVLDIDVHHGNGTQQIFYERDDVLTVSIHGNPEVLFPFVSGYADERGSDAGEGYNLNIPLAAGTEMAGYRPAFERALQRIQDFAPDAIVIAAGYDTFRGDPFGNLSLDTPDYAVLGQGIASLKLPTLFMQEGGYVIDALRANTRSLLDGYLLGGGR